MTYRMILAWVVLGACIGALLDQTFAARPYPLLTAGAIVVGVLAGLYVGECSGADTLRDHEDGRN